MYQADPEVDGSIGEEPVHEGPFGRHHVGIPFGFLLRREVWAVVVTWFVTDARWVGRWPEFVWLLKHSWLGRGCCRDMSQGGEDAELLELLRV